jgi:hypothetical protein
VNLGAKLQFSGVKAAVVEVLNSGEVQSSSKLAKEDRAESS